MSQETILVPTELVRKIDDNRGDISRASLIEFLIDSQLEHCSKDKYVTKEEIQYFVQDVKKLLKSFIDFFVSYGLELGKQSPQAEFGELACGLERLEKDLVLDAEDRMGDDGF